MKLLVAVIVLVILGGGVWFTQKEDSSATTEDSVKVGNAAGDVAAEKKIGETSGTAPTAQSQPATVVESDTAVPGDTAVGIEESAAKSPFATVAEPEIVAEPQTTQPNPLDSESVSTESNTTLADQDALQDTEREKFVVPQSYSVTEAAKYFIPKGERGPGRLGGPPPLDFPGGPSDPNAVGSGAFDPPTAPGN